MQEEVEKQDTESGDQHNKVERSGAACGLSEIYAASTQCKKQRSWLLKNEKPVGEQTIDQLLGQNQGATNIEIEKTDIKGFKRFLDKYGIDYAITKDPSQTPPRYLVFFKARDGDAMTAAFKEYSASLLQKQKKPSVLKQLNKLKQLVVSMPAKVRQKKQERDL